MKLPQRSSADVFNNKQKSGCTFLCVDLIRETWKIRDYSRMFSLSPKSIRETSFKAVILWADVKDPRDSELVSSDGT